jgi:hypothetical protein
MFGQEFCGLEVCLCTTQPGFVQLVANIGSSLRLRTKLVIECRCGMSKDSKQRGEIYHLNRLHEYNTVANWRSTKQDIFNS